MRRLLPRHLNIIYEINRRFLDSVRARGIRDHGKINRLSIITEGEDPSVKMASLGIVGSHKINGVAELHSKLVREQLFQDYAELYPDRFTNKTNGITPRRWLRQCNRPLAGLISDRIGDGWITQLDELQQLEPYANDPEFQSAFAKIKEQNKQRLADYIYQEHQIEVPMDAIFDIQIKRIHEYKRQLLAALHAITLYNRIKANPEGDHTPRVIIFAGKAAPGYTMAKLHIKLINSVADTINNDPDMEGKLYCFFLENYSVSLAEKMIPAADLSEQISTAGMEASGTGNMKFALNGALTIGTLDGANIEIKEEVGDDHIFIFGLTVEEVEKRRREGYRPEKIYRNNQELKHALDQIHDGFFEPYHPELFHPITEALLQSGDYFMVLADYQSYLDTQEKVEKRFEDKATWWKSAILNVARIGKFSSDRTIREYADEIWDVEV
jgi:starch phosphorylase